MSKISRLIQDLKRAEENQAALYSEYESKLTESGFPSMEAMWRASSYPLAKQKEVSDAFLEYVSAKSFTDNLLIQAEKIVAEEDARRGVR